MLVLIILLAFVIAGCLATLVASEGRRTIWTGKRKRKAAVIAVFVSLLIFAVAFELGFFAPFEEWATQWKVDAFEKRLYVGETRTAIEARFGREVPRPDEIDRMNDSVDYYYLVAGSFCVGYYRGAMVAYDSHDRVAAWTPHSFAYGC